MFWRGSELTGWISVDFFRLFLALGLTRPEEQIAGANSAHDLSLKLITASDQRRKDGVYRPGMIYS